MSQTQAHDIIAAMGYNRRVHVNGWPTVPYVAGSEKWETEDVISFLERGSYGRQDRTYICRHGDWKEMCASCGVKMAIAAEKATGLTA